MNKLIVLVCLVSMCTCWWDVGHMLTAEVARQELEQRDPVLLSQIEKIATAYNNLADDRSQTFVQAASWADDVKDKAMNFMYGWHFIDRPINPDGLWANAPEADMSSNSVTSMENFRFELQKKDYRPAQNSDKISMQKSFMMRMAVHVVGDIHQPLHNTNFYNSSYVKGDLGGNFQKIVTLQGKILNLHSYFDSGAEVLQDIDRPLNATSLTFLENFGKDLRNKYTRASFGARMNKTTPQQWSDESYAIARDFIYAFIKDTNKITPEFDTQAKILTQQQVTIGGYRLADWLYDTFRNTTSNNATKTSLQSEESSFSRRKFLEMN